MIWVDQLQPASFRGVPFKVKGNAESFGRNLAIHEYYGKDEIWPEDTGRAPRGMSLSGFLIGDDVFTQRENLIKAVETEGEGKLVHPSYGELQVSIPKDGLRTEEKWDKGRYIAFQLTFIEAGKRQFPATIINTGANVESVADEAFTASIESFVDRTEDALQYGATIVQEITAQANMWARTAQRLVNDATNIRNMVSTLEGSYGRYFGGRNRGFTSLTKGITGTSYSINQLLSMGASYRSNVTNVSSDLVSLSKTLGL